MGTSAFRGQSDKDIAGKDILLDCPILVDLSHGTIRHRMPDEKYDTDGTSKVKTGYFYHARLKDYSEDAEIPDQEDYKAKYVFKAPKNARGKRLYYVYGNKFTAEDSGIQRTEKRPTGKGFNWPESYRKANNLYYEITFVPQEEELVDVDEDSLSISTQYSSMASAIQKDNIEMKLRDSDTVLSVKTRLSLKLLLPETNIHLMSNKQELRNEDLIGDLRTEEQGRFSRFCIILKIS